MQYSSMQAGRRRRQRATMKSLTFVRCLRLRRLSCSLSFTVSVSVLSASRSIVIICHAAAAVSAAVISAAAVAMWLPGCLPRPAH